MLKQCGKEFQTQEIILEVKNYRKKILKKILGSFNKREKTLLLKNLRKKIPTKIGYKSVLYRDKKKLNKN